MLYGSMCLSAASNGAVLRPFPFQLQHSKQFHHTPHPQRGLVEITTDSPDVSAEIHLPQRSKTYWVHVDCENDWAVTALDYFKTHLPKMESQYESARQLYKLYQYQQELRKNPKSAAFNVTLLNNGEHAHVGLLSQWNDLFVVGIYDCVNNSVRLVWTDDEYVVSYLRGSDASRYVFYRFPVLSDRPLFLYTQALCSKWHTWMRTFGTSTDSVLKAFNALETFLYKEPELPTLTKLSNSNGRDS